MLQDKHRRNPIHLATMNGYVNLTKLFVEVGININEKDIYGKTPDDYAQKKKTPSPKTKKVRAVIEDLSLLNLH